jgi:hypothetical protein
MEDKETIHLQYFLNQTVEIAEYFENWLYPNQNDTSETDYKRSTYCDLYDVFSEAYQQKSGNSETISHNCIGCNFEEGADTINFFLQTNKNCKNIQYYLNLYSFLFYAQSERLAVIYKEVGYMTEKGEFNWSSFPNLQAIKYWANFFKHPKAYMFLHHPDFYIKTDPEKPNFKINGIIDDNFVKTFYRAGADNELLRKNLANKNNVKVFYPDLVETTKLLCNEFSKIISIIISDPIIIEKLEAYTTIKND